jgi:hypothetical protein
VDHRLRRGLVPDYGDRRPWSYQELSEERCELPGGPDVRCFTLTQWTYHEGDGGAPYELDQSVFDTRTGERLSVERVLAVGTGDGGASGGGAALARLQEVLCSDAGLRRGLRGRRREQRTRLREIPVTRAQPTADGVWFGFASARTCGSSASATSSCSCRGRSCGGEAASAGAVQIRNGTEEVHSPTCLTCLFTPHTVRAWTSHTSGPPT